MWLTALRRSPKDISMHPKNFMQSKTKPEPQTIISPDSSAIAYLILHTHERAGARGCAPPRTIAPYKHPVHMHALTLCLNRQPSAQGPAETCSGTCSHMLRLINFPPRYSHSQIPNTRMEPFTRGSQEARCGPETRGGPARSPNPSWIDNGYLPH